MQGKLLKGIGLALIALPEPLTTAIGAGLITVSFVVTRLRENKKRKYVRRILGEYLNTYRPFGYGMNYVPVTSAELPYRTSKPLYRLQTGNGTNHNPVSSVRQTVVKPVRFAPRAELGEIESPSIFHQLDQRAVAKRYTDTGGQRASFVGYWGRQAIIKFDTPVQHHLRLSPASLS